MSSPPKRPDGPSQPVHYDPMPPPKGEPLQESKPNAWSQSPSSLDDRVKVNREAINQATDPDAQKAAQKENPLPGRVSIIDQLMTSLYALGRLIKSLFSKNEPAGGDDLSYVIDVSDLSRAAKEAVVSIRAEGKRDLKNFKDVALYLAETRDLSAKGYHMKDDYEGIINTRIETALNKIESMDDPDAIKEEVDKAKGFIATRFELQFDDPALIDKMKVLNETKKIVAELDKSQTEFNISHNQPDEVDLRMRVSDERLVVYGKILDLQGKIHTLEMHEVNSLLAEIRTAKEKWETLLS